MTKNDSERMLVLVRSCGHERDVTNDRNNLPVGSPTACSSECDRCGELERTVRRYDVRPVGSHLRR